MVVDIAGLAPYVGGLVTAVGVLAFAVGVVVEVLKRLPGLCRLPTDLMVFVVSVCFSVVAVLAAGGYGLLVVNGYCVAGAIVLGFFVAFVAMFGWEKCSELWKRFYRK